MRKIIVILVLIIAIGACKKTQKPLKETQTENIQKNDSLVGKIFECPMECEKTKTYKKEGNCPVCKMKLRAKKTAEKHEGHEY